MGKVTIEDISRHTGLSRGTVSRALNDRPDISEATKQRVLEACRELNYVPSQAARSLATGRNYAVAVVVGDVVDPFAVGFLRGVMARAEHANYAVNVIELTNDPEQSQRRIQRLAHERIDSVLIAASISPADVSSLIEAVGEHPIVATSATEGLTADLLTPDYAESGRLAARHLLEQAGQDILYIHAGLDATAIARRDGFREALASAGVDAAAAVLDVPPSASDGDWQMVQERLGQVRGVAATSDSLAISACYAAARAGRTVGVDLAVIGQGNTPVGAAFTPALSTTDFGGDETGRRALDISLQRVSKTRLDQPEQVSVTPSLVIRDSSRFRS